MPICPARPASGTTGPLAGGGNGSGWLPVAGAGRATSSPATASTAPRVPDSTRVARAGPAPGLGLRRSHIRPASASTAAAPTRPALTSSTRP